MGRRKDGAVSPAIGTILLVALTVVFVAVAAVVATGIAGGMFDTKQVGLTLEPYSIDSESERGISLTVHGGADAGDLVSLAASLNGPELVYQDGNSSVKNPVVGTGYRFKAVESTKTVSGKRDNSNIDVELNTTEILPVNATEYYVTVTGTFRDGTEQVLLIQKVTLPAISGKGVASDENQYIFVRPYSTSRDYPSHGFIVKIRDASLKESDIDWNNVEFWSYTKNKKVNIGSRAGQTETERSYDITDTWWQSPYPDKQTYWKMYEITGEVTVPITVDGKSQKVRVTVTVLPRVNIFEDKDNVAGTFHKQEGNKIKVTFEKKNRVEK